MVEVKNQPEAPENKSEGAKVEANIANWTDKQKEEGASNFEKNTANSEKISNVNTILDITQRFFFSWLHEWNAQNGKDILTSIKTSSDQVDAENEDKHNITSFKKLWEFLQKNNDQQQNIATMLEPILKLNAWYAYTFLDELLSKFDRGETVQKIHIDAKTNYFVKYDGKMQNVRWLFQNAGYDQQKVRDFLNQNHKKLYDEYLKISTNETTSSAIGDQEVKTLSSFSPQQSMALQGNDQEFFNRLSRYDWNITPMSKFEDAQDQTRKSFYKNPFNTPNPIGYEENFVQPENRTEVKIKTVMVNIS